MKSYVPFRGPVEDFFAQPIPNVLWHYTSIDALAGIISSQSIWATEAHFTNDREEFIHARNVAEALLDRTKPDSRKSDLALRYMREQLQGTFDTGPASKSKTEVFIACFSAARDRKSQWNDYADNSRGVSIGFDLRGMRLPPESRATLTFAPCVYAASEKERLLSTALDHLVEAGETLIKKSEDRRLSLQRFEDFRRVDRIFGRQSTRADFLRHVEMQAKAELDQGIARSTYDLLRLASHCKNSFFIEEEEWRFAIPHLKSTALPEGEVRHRGKAIPYIAFEPRREDGLLPIVEVLLAPLCPAASEVERILSTAGFGEVPIKLSEAPYRDTSSL